MNDRGGAGAVSAPVLLVVAQGPFAHVLSCKPRSTGGLLWQPWQCLEERDLIDALIDSGCTPFVWPQKLPIAAIDPEQGLRVKSISALKRSDQVFGERTMALHLEEESLVVEGDTLVFWTLNAPP